MNWLILKQLILDNDMEKFAVILQQNAGILEQRSNESLDTVLHLATRYGRIELVAEILRLSPFMVGAENKEGETPLHEACRLGHDKILMMLLETDPWVASKLNCQDQSALYLACCYGHLKAACIFLNQPWLQELDDGENATFLHVAASVEVSERIPRFGEPSDRETSSRRQKISRRRMRQHKYQSEKSRKNLIRLYQKQHKRREIYREALHNARETITLVAILIATITYTGGINPPGGVYQDGPLRGTALAARRTAFKVFSICNNVALFSSLCIVIVFVSIIPFRRKPLMLMLMVAHKAMWVAVGFMAAAYFASSLVLMPPPHGQRMDWTVVSLLSISAATLGSVFVGLGFMLMRHHLKKLRYRKKVTDSKEHGQTAKDTDTDADKNSVEFGDSINSDMDISIVFGYHAY